MPVQLKDKNWISGCVIDGVEWCTNGQWAMQSEFVKVPDAGLRAWGTGQPWSAGIQRRSPVAIETIQSILDLSLKGDPGAFTDLLWGEDSKWRRRLVLSEDGSKYAWLREIYLPKAATLWTPIIGGPLQGVGLVRIKRVEGEEVRELMGVVMPMNLNINNEVNEVLDRLHSAMITQAELAEREKKRKAIAARKARAKAK